MSTLLVAMLLMGRTWTPIYGIQYLTEAACMAEAAKLTDTSWNSQKKAVCVPTLMVKP